MSEKQWPCKCYEPHRIDGKKAWCDGCSEWCYPHASCIMGELMEANEMIRALEAELDSLRGKERYIW